MSREAINILKAYTDGKQNTEKVEVSVMQLNRVIKALQEESCDDVISRQDVKDTLYDAIKIRELNYRQIVECIDELPSVAPVEIEPKLLINTDEVVKKLCNIIIQRESKEYYSIKITANERCENVIADKSKWCSNCDAKMESEE